MAKDFRNESQLPDDFLTFDFGTESHNMIEDAEEKFGKDEVDRLSKITYAYGFGVDSNMVGTKDAVEAAALKELQDRNEGVDLSDITVEARNPECLSLMKDGVEFMRCYGMITVNEKYMDEAEEGPEQYPLIPTKDKYEYLGCSWLDHGDPTWEDFERVENALAANKAVEDELAAGLDEISMSDDGLKR